MKYEIKNSFSRKVQFTAEIECDENAVISVKIGLAVKWAIERGADLGGADLGVKIPSVRDHYFISEILFQGRRRRLQKTGICRVRPHQFVTVLE